MLKRFLLGVLLGWGAPALATDDSLAQQLLSKALENQYRGRYQADLEFVEDSFLNGRDYLAGKAEFADDIGERKLALSGSGKSFEYRSLDFGREQWIVNGNSQRIRRIANRQGKKGAFGTLLTYEDMLKFPSDFFFEYGSCKGVKSSDSIYQISMSLKPAFQTFYGHLEVTLGKYPVLLKEVTFYDLNHRKMKSMSVKGYKEVAGRYLVTDAEVFDCDSTASLQMCFKNFSFAEIPLAQIDKSGKKPAFNLFSRLTDILPKGSEAAAREAVEEGQEASN